MSLPSLTSAGMLPLGRWHCSLSEIEATFVVGQDPLRGQIWAEFTTATTALSRIVHVCSMWLGGSFLTDKPQPGDIECVYLVDERTKPASPAGASLFDQFVQNRIKSRHGLRVDTFVVTWRYRPEVAVTSLDERNFLAQRGYWDDFWQRRRHGSPGSVHPNDALPERGYLEVVAGGYHAATPHC